MAKTYEPIATTTLSSRNNSITLNSIPSTYTDLVLVFVGGLDPSANELNLRLNSDTGSNYSYTRIRGNSSSLASDRQSNVTEIHVGSPGNSSIIGNSVIEILNYSNTATYKTVLARSNYTNRDVISTVGLWRNTAAINSITIKESSVNYLIAGSTLTIYGVKAA